MCDRLTEPPKIQRLLKIDTKLAVEDAPFLVDSSVAAHSTEGDQSLNKNVTWIDEKVLMVRVHWSHSPYPNIKPMALWFPTPWWNSGGGGLRLESSGSRSVTTVPGPKVQWARIL